jgi:3-oxoacyl-[acyl-carrier protein] reductase
MAARLAVVSGGGTGMGAAIARSLATAGDRVVIVGRREDVLRHTAEQLGAATGGRVVPMAADLSRPDQVGRLVARIVGEFGDQVDVIVNNAGGTVSQEEAGLVAVERAWRRNFEANVLTAVLLTTALLPRLSSPGGRVVNISSIAALRGGGDAYSAAKAALIGWTYSLAQQLGPRGITANVVAPGFVENTEFFGG